MRLLFLYYIPFQDFDEFIDDYLESFIDDFDEYTESTLEELIDE